MHIGIGSKGPFYQTDVHIFQFQAGNAVRMNTASAIIITDIGFRKCGAVCMSGDQDMVFLFSPVVQTLLRFLLFGIIFGCAGRIQDAIVFQGFPQISHQKTGKTPEGGIEKICLMPMGEIDIFEIGIQGILQDDSRIESYIRQKGLPFQMRIVSAAARIDTAISYRVVAILFDHIMISVQHVQTPLSVEQGQKGENVSMCFNDLLHATVLPKFVPITQLDISITGTVIMLQGGIIQVLVFQEIIIGGTDTPMAVAEQNIFCAVIQREPGYSLK